MSTITPTMIARAAALGAAGAALSVTKNPRLVRGLSLATAAGLGGFAAYATATGDLGPLAQDEGGEARALEGRPLPQALALGLGVAAVSAGVSELGVRAQGGLERWADRTTGRPRLAVALVTAATSLVMDVVEQRVDPDAR